MATIRDVAKAAGVSVATVSRVLNDTGYVHQDTRKRVAKAIKELNYSPNEVARSLYKRESRLIGLLLPDITNPFFPELARGVEDEVHRQGFRVILGNSDENEQKELDYIHTFSKNNIVGIISATNNPIQKNYGDLHIPVVFLDRVSDKHLSVYADGVQGGCLAATEMIARGSKNIVIIQGPPSLRPAQDRFRGAMQVLQSENVDVQVVQTNSFAFADAQKWANELFHLYPETDGVIASNDIVATAVLHEALRRGKKIPDDLQIIGFDDIPQSKLLFPPLSTIRQPAYDMGTEAANLLIKLIKKEQVDERNIQLPVTFIERETTRKVD
ncbi:LacI family DNA-binding transcriptional regulator [Priestia koreensis]|uniref:LacI family DNA-binding transcriptional regulator n=1 Tax=Priestia koreensis TaxID=284581 RepID=UPI001F5A9240|nr:LacI family DNA-binding transcriptional regulator [Priestia koreensis]UNL85401.1 LacI family DNA-binding transcriptional regulator [Priestia koreensis]